MEKSIINIKAAESHLSRMRFDVRAMQAKLKRAITRPQINSSWRCGIELAIFNRLENIRELDRDVVRFYRDKKRKEADFYWNFYNAANDTMFSDMFTAIEQEARRRMGIL